MLPAYTMASPSPIVPMTTALNPSVLVADYKYRSVSLPVCLTTIMYHIDLDVAVELFRFDACTRNSTTTRMQTIHEPGLETPRLINIHDLGLGQMEVDTVQRRPLTDVVGYLNFSVVCWLFTDETKLL